MSDLAELLALNCLDLSSIKMARLLARFGSARSALDERCGGDVSATAIAASRKAAREEIEIAAKHGISIMTRNDATYPSLLRETFDAPPILYAFGSCNAGLQSHPAIAVVGARKADAYGLTTAEFFSSGLAQHGLAVVSGLAYGIDAAAHKAAISAGSAGGVTIAVLGSGLLNIYPSEHRRLAMRIKDSGGAVLSEFPLRTKPLQKNFPRRNRIIAGMTYGTIVIQAGLKSGSLITAKLAADYGRTVWAIPGRIGEDLSRGALSLIRDGATIATSPDDIFEDLAPQLGSISLAGNQPHDKQVVTVSDIVLQSLGSDGATLDELVERCSLTREELQRRILKLELAGKLTYRPGGAYRLAGH